MERGVFIDGDVSGNVFGMTMLVVRSAFTGVRFVGCTVVQGFVVGLGAILYSWIASGVLLGGWWLLFFSMKEILLAHDLFIAVW